MAWRVRTTPAPRASSVGIQCFKLLLLPPQLLLLLLLQLLLPILPPLLLLPILPPLLLLLLLRCCLRVCQPVQTATLSDLVRGVVAPLLLQMPWTERCVLCQQRLL